jgi:haloacetate dehalogenase
VHAICEEYRAAATLDRTHDAADQALGRTIVCPVLALWSALGGLATWYSSDGGPLALWRLWAEDVHGREIGGGHFFPEDASEETTEALQDFLAPQTS